VDSINKGVLPTEQEVLTETQRLNEYIMTSLRTSEGLDLSKVQHVWGAKVREILVSLALCYEEAQQLTRKDGFLLLTRQGKLFADGIAAALFQDKVPL
jgi:oxygen-independent coproporphyrinogen-3 oxidase